MPDKPSIAEEPFDLKMFEAWMFRVVSDPHGVEGGLTSAKDLLGVDQSNLDQLVNPSKERTATQRLGVYADMYFWRLVDILADEHLALVHALGGRHDFHHLAVDFLHAHPSRHYRLSPLGDPLPEWILHEAPVGDYVADEHRAFLSELAQLERYKEAVFDEKQSARLSPAELAAIPPEAWGEARLHVVPALRLLRTRYPVNAYFQAFINDEEPEIPAEDESFCVIWRQEYEVWRLNLGKYAFLVLKALSEGRTLGDALESAVVDHDADPDWLLSQVGGWFTQWTADGFFRAAELPNQD